MAMFDLSRAEFDALTEPEGAVLLAVGEHEGTAYGLPDGRIVFQSDGDFWGFDGPEAAEIMRAIGGEPAPAWGTGIVSLHRACCPWFPAAD